MRKQYQDIALYKTINVLYKTSDLTSPTIKEINIKVNSSNSRIVRILNVIYENVSLKDK